jgi:hypothetical protein
LPGSRHSCACERTRRLTSRAPPAPQSLLLRVHKSQAATATAAGSASLRR